MKLIPDSTGRLKNRPHFEKGEIDIICEDEVGAFLLDRYGEARFPISTGDLEVLIETKTKNFDPYADLSREGDRVEGMTIFSRSEKPKVLISETLGDGWHENRRRTTITHELGHVILHAPILAEALMESSLVQVADPVIRCRREDIISPRYSDWLEWQAGYASGAYLMPASYVEKVANEVQELRDDFGPFDLESLEARGLVSWTKRSFNVSSQAARVRLLQLGFLTEAHKALPLG